MSFSPLYLYNLWRHWPHLPGHVFEVAVVAAVGDVLELTRQGHSIVVAALGTDERTSGNR